MRRSESVNLPIQFRRQVLIIAVSVMVLFLVIPSAALADHFRIEKVTLPFQGNPTLVAAFTPQHFMVADPQMRLYRYRDGEWSSPLSPPSGNWRYVRYFARGENDIYAAALSLDYETRIYHLIAGNWVFDGLDVPQPLLHLQELEDGSLWLSGDWGLLYEKVDKVWKRVHLTTGNHILAIDGPSRDKFWYGARGDGLFLRFLGADIPVEIPGHESVDFKELHFDGEKIVVGLRNGKMYSVTGDTVRQWKPTGTERAEWKGMGEDGRTYIFAAPGHFLLYRDGVMHDYALPYDIVRDVKVMAGDVSLIVTRDGDELVIGWPDKGTFFYDLTSSLRIGGSPGDMTAGCAITDLNDDDLPELFILNIGPSPYNQLFLANERGNTYSDITKSSGIDRSSGAEQLVIGDVNGDAFEDLILLFQDTVGYRLELMINAGGDHFEPPRRIKFQEPTPDSPADMILVDEDRDGDLDLLLTYYYGSGSERRGGNTLLVNNGWGGFSQKSNIGDLEARGWNQMTLFADFTDNGWLDALVLKRWINSSFLVGGKEGFSIDTLAIPDLGVEGKTSALAADIDRDGDLDIVLAVQDITLRILLNDGQGRFTDATDQLVPSVARNSNKTGNLSGADINGDGWLDLLIGGGRDTRGGNLVLLGSAQGFQESTIRLGLKEPAVTEMMPLDVDADGDLDIFGYRFGTNVLWINPQDGSDFLGLDLRGAGSNPSAWHARWWVYEAGHLNQPDYLLADGQLNAHSSTASLAYGGESVRVGVAGYDLVDVRVKFYGGSDHTYLGLKTGRVHILREHPVPLQVLFLAPSRVVAILSCDGIQRHLFGFIIIMSLLLLELQLGTQRLFWQVQTSLFITLVSLTVYWFVLTLSLESESAFKYLIAPLATTVFIGVSLGFSFWQRHHTKASRGQILDDLLEHLLVFAHGAWASSNLDSIRRLSEFALRSESVEPGHYEQLNERWKTWVEMTYPNLSKIVELAKPLRILPGSVDRLEDCKVQLNTILSDNGNWQTKGLDERAGIANQLVSIIDELRENLRRLRDAVYRRFSCDVGEVLHRTLGELAGEFERAGVPLPHVVADEGRVWGLIRGWELADIVDNGLRNALWAVGQSPEKRIELQLQHHTGRIQIHVRDTGIGVPEGEEEAIFEEGYSRSGGTGHGLAQARRILNRYGGNLFLTESQPGEGSTFTIQLNEGREILETTNSHY